MAADELQHYMEATSRLRGERDILIGKWHLVEKYCERYPDDWRLVFKRDDKIIEISVTEEQWRAFDGD